MEDRQQQQKQHEYEFFGRDFIASYKECDAAALRNIQELKAGG